MASPNRPLLKKAEFLAGNSDLKDCLWLVSNGVPYDIAFSLPEDERLAYVVILAEFQGLTFNWSKGQFEKPKS